MEIDWIIAGPVIAGIIGLIIGYFIGYAAKKVPDNRAEIESWQNKYETKSRELNNSIERRKALESDISSLQTQLSNVESELASSKSKLNAVQNIAGGSAAGTTPAYDANLVETHYGKRVMENDLTIIEGIDIEIAAILKDRGITTWKELAHTSPERCRTILTDSGRNYEIYQPGTWPEQARLAYNGQWSELRNWQANHHHAL